MEATEEVTPVSLGYDRIRFTAPVRIGDTVTVRYTIRSVEPERSRSRAKLRAMNQHGETVGVGEHIMKWVPNPAFGSGRDDRDG